MDRPKSNNQPLPTIWEIPDDVWPMLQTMLDEHYPAKPTGHRRVDLRRVLNGILFRLRTGCQWHQLPQQFGDDRTVHRHFQPWCHQGLFKRLWAMLVQEGAALNGVDWPWQAADTMMGNARMGGDLGGRHPTDRGQKGCSEAWWWRRRAAPWAPRSLGPTSTTPSSWRPPSRPS